MSDTTERTDLSALEQEQVLQFMSEFNENPESRIETAQMVRQWMICHPNDALVQDKQFNAVLNEFSSTDVKLLKIKSDAGLSDGMKRFIPLVQAIVRGVSQDPYRIEKPVQQMSAPTISDAVLPDDEPSMDEMKIGDDSSEYNDIFNS